MKQLFLIRHAKSSWKQRGLPDHERPLSSRGRRQLATMGPVIRSAGALDKLVFCSTAVRARLTLQGLLDPSVRPRTTFDQTLYTFDDRHLQAWLALREEDHITIVGHNPALEDFVDSLVPDGPGHLPTCSFLHIELPIQSWHDLDKKPGRLLRYDTPKRVRSQSTR